MSDHKWKERKIMEEEDEEENESRVRPVQHPPTAADSSSTRRMEKEQEKIEEGVKRSSSPDSGGSGSRERRHKRKHNKHHHRHKKSRKKSRSTSPTRSSQHRKRSRSKSRSRSRSRDGSSRYRGGGGSRCTNEDDREMGDKFRHRIQSSGKRDRNLEQKSRSRRPDCDHDDDDDLDLANTGQPFSSGAVPAAASKLKAEIEKRKQLWGKKDKPPETASSSTVWKKTAFSDDNDGRVSAKFKRLMGIKDDAPSSADKDHAAVSNMSDKQRQDYFANLEKQYEVARATTHTQRGLGLGFSARLFPR